MAMNKLDIVFFLAAAMLVVLVLAVVLVGAFRLCEDQKACEARGGVMVKLYNGFECIEVRKK
jgi:hypothetical protein